MRPARLAYLFDAVPVACQCRLLIKLFQSVSGSVYLCFRIAALSYGGPVFPFTRGASTKYEFLCRFDS